MSHWLRLKPCEIYGLGTGYRLSPHPTALLHRWYSLVKEKRQPKLDFLKSFLRAFDVDVAVLSCSQVRTELTLPDRQVNLPLRTVGPF